MKKKLTCIVCPLGCEMEVEFLEDRVVSVEGNTCKRGEKYAHDECTNPKRVITTTIRGKDGIIPVKTSVSVSKEKIFSIMNIINGLYVKKEVLIGETVFENIDGEGANLVVTGRASM